jgi:hypothetical protein
VFGIKVNYEKLYMAQGIALNEMQRERDSAIELCRGLTDKIGELEFMLTSDRHKHNFTEEVLKKFKQAQHMDRVIELYKEVGYD